MIRIIFTVLLTTQAATAMNQVQIDPFKVGKKYVEIVNITPDRQSNVKLGYEIHEDDLGRYLEFGDVGKEGIGFDDDAEVLHLIKFLKSNHFFTRKIYFNIRNYLKRTCLLPTFFDNDFMQRKAQEYARGKFETSLVKTAELSPEFLKQEDILHQTEGILLRTAESRAYPQLFAISPEIARLIAEVKQPSHYLDSYHVRKLSAHLQTMVAAPIDVLLVYTWLRFKVSKAKFSPHERLFEQKILDRFEPIAQQALAVMSYKKPVAANTTNGSDASLKSLDEIMKDLGLEDEKINETKIKNQRPKKKKTKDQRTGSPTPVSSTPSRNDIPENKPCSSKVAQIPTQAPPCNAQMTEVESKSHKEKQENYAKQPTNAANTVKAIKNFSYPEASFLHQAGHHLLDTLARLINFELNKVNSKPGSVSFMLAKDGHDQDIFVVSVKYRVEGALIQKALLDQIDLALIRYEEYRDPEDYIFETREKAKQSFAQLEILTKEGRNMRDDAYFKAMRDLELYRAQGDRMVIAKLIKESCESSSLEKRIKNLLTGLSKSQIRVLPNPQNLHSEMVMVNFIKEHKCSLAKYSDDQGEELPYQYVGGSIKSCKKCWLALNGSTTTLGHNQKPNQIIVLTRSFTAFAPKEYVMPKWIENQRNAYCFNNEFIEITAENQAQMHLDQQYSLED